MVLALTWQFLLSWQFNLLLMAYIISLNFFLIKTWRNIHTKVRIALYVCLCIHSKLNLHLYEYECYSVSYALLYSVWNCKIPCNGNAWLRYEMLLWQNIADGCFETLCLMKRMYPLHPYRINAFKLVKLQYTKFKRESLVIYLNLGEKSLTLPSI